MLLKMVSKWKMIFEILVMENNKRCKHQNEMENLAMWPSGSPPNLRNRVFFPASPGFSPGQRYHHRKTYKIRSNFRSVSETVCSKNYQQMENGRWQMDRENISDM